MSSTASGMKDLQWLALGLALPPLLGGCLLTIDDSKLDEPDAIADARARQDAGAREDAPPFKGDEVDSACWNGVSPTELTLAAHAVSESEILVSFTKGPPYRLVRVDSSDGEGPITFELPPCEATFDDTGVTPVKLGTRDGGGLQPSWRYTYTLTVLRPDADVDPRYAPLMIQVLTWFESDGGTDASYPDARVEFPNAP